MSKTNKFIEAHDNHYNRALKEIKNGKKESHWMWYIFPQIEGLGYSPVAQKYSIKDRKEAEEYISNPILLKHLIEISEALLELKTNDAYDVFEYPDELKLKSCMTLFWIVSNNIIFKQVLDKFYNGEMCDYTVDKLTDKEGYVPKVVNNVTFYYNPKEIDMTPGLILRLEYFIKDYPEDDCYTICKDIDNGNGEEHIYIY